MHIFYCVKLQLLVEQNPVIPNINSGAKTILYIYYYECTNCIYYIIYCTHIRKTCGSVKCITSLTWAENRSDMDCE